MTRKILSAIFFFSYTACSSTIQASGTPIQKLCYLQLEESQAPYLFVSADTSSQAAAVKKNEMLQRRRIIFSSKKSNTLFYKDFLSYGDCLLVNLDETISLEAYEELNAQNEWHRKFAESNFLPAVYCVHKDKSKRYGLVDTKQLQQLTVSNAHREAKTSMIVNYTNNIANDLFLIYITCPSDRNSLCDLSIKQNGVWLKDKKTGARFNLKVLARSQREGNTSEKSQRTHINNDTPQGIYYIWGAVTGGGNSGWHRLARIDLDAASPPINSNPYNINSYLLSRIVPDEALDDYWLNEWPLAYNLGRISLRIAPGDFEARQARKIEMSSYNETEGCINTGRNHEKLLEIIVNARIFTKDEVFDKSENSEAKQWHVARKLGKALVIIKDRD